MYWVRHLHGVWDISHLCGIPHVWGIPRLPCIPQHAPVFPPPCSSPVQVALGGDMQAPELLSLLFQRGAQLLLGRLPEVWEGRSWPGRRTRRKCCTPQRCGCLDGVGGVDGRVDTWVSAGCRRGRSGGNCKCPCCDRPIAPKLLHESQHPISPSISLPSLLLPIT